jgi:hypothetical protein
MGVQYIAPGANAKDIRTFATNISRGGLLEGNKYIRVWLVMTTLV